MAIATTETETEIEAGIETVTVADLLAQLGDVPPERVIFRPYPPGTATEQDLIAYRSRGGHPCELVDGVLVEKAMGYEESALAAFILTCLMNFVRRHDLGIVVGADGPHRLVPGLVRYPDVAFASWDRFPGRRLPKEPIPGLVPDLAVEVLSAGNTRKEMERKLREYFSAGVRLVWYVDPPTRTVTVYTGVERLTVFDAAGTLDGGDVLPGFALPLTELWGVGQ